MPVNIVKVTRDEPATYEAFQVTAERESAALTAKWLYPQLSGQVDFLENMSEVLASGKSNIVGNWIVKSSDRELAQVVRETDFAADWTIVEDDPFDALVEQEFSTPELSDEMKERGEFHTEEVWQCYEFWVSRDAQWYDATDEANARARSKAAGFPGKVRVQTITTVIGPWRNA